MNSSKYVLLFGMPRSGTTWVGKLFDSHKDINYLHEPDSVEPSTDIPLLVEQNSPMSEQLKGMVSKWLQPTAEKVIASRPFFKKSYMSLPQWWLFLLTAYASKISAKLKLPFSFKPIRTFSNAPVTVWKSIESLGRVTVVQELLGAQVVQIIRHPCGQIASTFRGEKMHVFEGSIETSEDWDFFDRLIKHSDEHRFSLEDIKKMYPEERLAFRWGVINDYALKRLNKTNSTVLIYEDLCRQPKEKIAELFTTLGLTLKEETLAYINESTGGDDTAYYATQKVPLVAAYKWKDELSTEQISRIANMVSHFESGKFYVDDF